MNLLGSADSEGVMVLIREAEKRDLGDANERIFRAFRPLVRLRWQATIMDLCSCCNTVLCVISGCSSCLPTRNPHYSLLVYL